MIISGALFGWGLFALSRLYFSRMLTLGVAAAIGAMILAGPALLWAHSCFDSRRSPDFHWGDWKTRKE
jgi:hypothetical protein